MVSMEEQIAITLPLDNGFVRRACPTCEREFKWLFAESQEEATEPDDRGYCCPYCGVWAQPDQWQPRPRSSTSSRSRWARSPTRPTRFLAVQPPRERAQVHPRRSASAASGMPPEPADMRRVDFECHPEDQLKVAEDWGKPVHCLICGETDLRCLSSSARHRRLFGEYLKRLEHGVTDLADRPPR